MEEEEFSKSSYKSDGKRARTRREEEGGITKLLKEELGNFLVERKGSSSR